MSKSKYETRCVHLVLNFLKENGAQITADMAVALGYSHDSILKAVIELRDTVPKRIFIRDWLKRPSKRHIPLYEYGTFEDAVKPAPLRIHKNTRATRRFQADLEDSQLDLHLEKEREQRRRAALSQPIFRHWQDECLFGVYHRD